MRLGAVLVTYTILLLIAVFAGRLHRSSRPALRTLGIGLIVLLLLFAWALTVSFMRWGITQSALLSDIYSQSATRAILFVMNATVLFGWCVARLWRKSTPSQPA